MLQNTTTSLNVTGRLFFCVYQLGSMLSRIAYRVHCRIMAVFSPASSALMFGTSVGVDIFVVAADSSSDTSLVPVSNIATYLAMFNDLAVIAIIVMRVWPHCYEVHQLRVRFPLSEKLLLDAFMDLALLEYYLSYQRCRSKLHKQVLSWNQVRRYWTH
ncbi:hypothetical protein PsYK624_138700 [Phanerochaete sordida]|uniref:Uncharacterized protein n=1 Tax=Phanerochaete sordida TaxID=48140 RepID=A0A9P3GNV2_9APHY|nr:hypothetical protein PsYK624_138700 [Phanerochaete sordida]